MGRKREGGWPGEKLCFEGYFAIGSALSEKTTFGRLLGNGWKRFVKVAFQAANAIRR